MPTANSAAFGPRSASPMANVATGTPRGIWTIEYSESCPPRWRVATGTPSTGTTVFAASIPGRCAAPPAPAMIARSPRPAAASAKANISSGMRWADTGDAISWGTAKRSSTCTAALIVAQSLTEPHHHRHDRHVRHHPSLARDGSPGPSVTRPRRVSPDVAASPWWWSSPSLAAAAAACTVL